MVILFAMLEALLLASPGTLGMAVSKTYKFALFEMQELKHLLVPGAGRDIMGLMLATALFVPIMKKLGTSPIIGFLLMGMLLGPSGFDFLHCEHQAHFLAEFGIVFFLFEMGLELSIAKVLSLKFDVFVLGFIQYVGTGVILAGLTKIIVPSLEMGALVVLGGAMALSTSAFVLQLIKDKGQLGTRYGRASLGVLLFQDMAVVPLLVMVPLLASSGGAEASLSAALSRAGAKAILAVSMIVILGKFVLNKVFYLVMSVKSSEAFLSVTLLTVLLSSSITEGLGLSNTLGAFLGGVLLAETSYRHQIEADIAPFRGMLLGLFFVTVGFSIDLHLILSQWMIIVPLITGLLVVKASVVAAACYKAGLPGTSTVQAALLLAPGGEFAFVAFGLAERLKLLSPATVSLLVTSTALSMALTPAMAKLGDNLSARIRMRRNIKEGGDTEGKAILQQAQSSDAGFVVLCGYGRIGRVVADLLDAQGMDSYIAFDQNPAVAIKARAEGLPVFLADCTRREVLENFKIGSARLAIVALNDKSSVNQAVTTMTSSFPDLPILARAFDLDHQDYLSNTLGVNAVVPQLPSDSVLLSLPFGGAVLRRMGYKESDIDGLLEEKRREIYQVETADPMDLSAAFKLVDSDGDGELDRTELRRGLSNAGKVVTDAEFEELFRQADTNQDGVIDFKEFARLMSRQVSTGL